MGAHLRGDFEQVTPLELFFDLVFVLAITQCTALMAADPTWEGVTRGLLALAVLWWCWTGYAWLTSVIDPEDELVRITLFGAMAALLVAAMCVPGAFGDDAVIAVAYGVVRVAHIALFLLAGRGDPNLRRSVIGLGVSSGIGVVLIAAAAFTDGLLQGALWAAAIAIDMGGPFLFGADGWKLAPSHFAERHGLIVLIALGESIVAIGVGAGAGIDGGVVAAAVTGIAVTAALWWLYFDVTAIVAEQRLAEAPAGRVQNELARDAFSFLHFPMVAGVVLLALGLKKTLGDVEEPLKLVPAAALLGGTALYLLGHVAFRLRIARRFSRERTAAAVACAALLALSGEVPALVLALCVLVILVAVIAIEAHRFAEIRGRVRSRDAHPH
jgi:low temperature requirement protein LtrA